MSVNGFVGSAGAASGGSAELTVQQVLQLATAYSSMSCSVATAPASGVTATFTLRVNGANSSPLLTCSITGPATSGTNTIAAPGVTVAAGDRVAILVGANTPSTPGSFALAP
jgi:hypothetical protein